MFIKKLHIDNFRLFKNKDFIFGKHITVIAGFNTTGKSTLLGLLGHCGELRKHKPLIHTNYRAELGEILKFSRPYDKGISSIGEITFEDLPTQPSGIFPPKLQYRSTWQKYKQDSRYRIIPKKTIDWNSSAKIPWPTLYVGLGRLYPVGESLRVETDSVTSKMDDTENGYVLANMVSILSMTGQAPKDFTAVSIIETSKKMAVGVNTDTYNYLSNSAGQDNLGQILMAVLSFKKLKTRLGTEWHGGLLVIDELDAALHPLAQNKLFDFLYKQSKEIGIQIIFTTHSLGLLDHIGKKVKHNKENITNKIELIYLTNANGPVEVKKNPAFDWIYSNMMARYNDEPLRKITVLSEDEEARYFFKPIIEEHLHRLLVLDVHFGKDQLLKLLHDDYDNFSRFLFVLDGDAGDIDSDYKCVIKLPGCKRPEEVIWDYLNNLPCDHSFLTWGERHGYSLMAFRENGPLSEKFSGFTPEREKYKAWFKANRRLMDDALKYWMKDNRELVMKFEADFIQGHNYIAKNSFLPTILS